MDLGLSDKRALVLGSTSGIGFAIAQVLAAEGAKVIVAGRDADRAAQAARKAGARESVALDLSREDSILAGLKTVLASGPIDILVNNVGGPATGSPLNIALEDWDRGYQSLLRSVLLCCREVVPGMRDRGWGRILTITSTSARELIPKLPVSSTFRAGLTALAKELAKELGRSGILINNLLPGPTNTGRIDELKTKSPEFYQSMLTRSALGRLGEPEEVARAAAFLLSSANGFITGTDVLVDGGYTSAL